MPRVGIIHHQCFLEHETGQSHPENKGRLDYLYSFLRRSDLNSKLKWIPSVSAHENELLRLHSRTYLDYVIKACGQESAILDDGDTRVSPRSHEAALHAVGGAIAGLESIHHNEYNRVFVAARPPGHHAGHAHAMGFCLYNTVALAALYALDELGYERLMILDWDVHHGNGTQDAFYQDPRVLFCSIHQYPFYPGTGSSNEKGIGEGEGFTLNIPLDPGADMEVYREVFRNRVLPSAYAFEPQLLLVSAGFDAHEKDPLANMNLRDEDFGELTRMTLDIANRYCEGKVLSVLEGGYHPEALAKSIYHHLLAFAE